MSARIQPTYRQLSDYTDIELSEAIERACSASAARYAKGLNTDRIEVHIDQLTAEHDRRQKSITEVTRYAITSAPMRIAKQYLPANYRVIGEFEVSDGRMASVIAGTDNAGWTLDDYVKPRLQSGLHRCTEIDSDHPVMALFRESEGS